MRLVKLTLFFSQCSTLAFLLEKPEGKNNNNNCNNPVLHVMNTF